MTLICTHCGETIQPGDESNPGRAGRPTSHRDPLACFLMLGQRITAAEARPADLATENESLRVRLSVAETDLEDFVTEAVEQNCGVPNSHGTRIFSHSFMATYEGWIEFLVQRGKMHRLDDDRELYVFVDELPPSKEAPAPPA